MKREILAVWIIVILLITNLTSLYFLLTGKQAGYVAHAAASVLKPSFKGPIADATAFNGVDAFRDIQGLNGYGVLYDADTIRRYLDSDFRTIHNRMSVDTALYHWKLGFYWMLSKGTDSLDRLDFCVVPTLVLKSDSTKVMDYFDKNVTIYKHPLSAPGTSLPEAAPSDSSGDAYDEGQLWP